MEKLHMHTVPSSFFYFIGGVKSMEYIDQHQHSTVQFTLDETRKSCEVWSVVIPALVLSVTAMIADTGATQLMWSGRPTNVNNKLSLELFFYDEAF